MKKFLIKTETWFSRIKNNGFFQASVGFLVFLLLAAALMFTIESTHKGTSFINFFHSLWFTIVTVTTVGYGDMSPYSTLGRIAAVAIMFTGIGYSGILTGNITSWLVEKNRKKALGLVPLKKKQNHLVVFGWRSDLAVLLVNILKQHRKTSKYLVLVNNEDINKVNDLRQNPNLRDLYFFRGDYSNTEVLHNACISTADKALILANEESGKSADEIDFKTVLAAKAVERLNPNIFTVAEIIQPEFSSSLNKANVEETVRNRYTCRALLSNLALMSGLHAVFRSLFDLNQGLLQVKKLSRKYLNQSYSELVQSFEDIQIIGVLENSGNLEKLKHDKMKEIQKSVSIQLAIKNLMEIKNMQSNFPIINPPPNYLVKENSSIIYLQSDASATNNWYMEKVKYNTEKGITKDKDFIVSRLQEIIPQHISYDKLILNLEELGIELYIYKDKISGVIYENNKYPIDTLAMSDEVKTHLNSIHDRISKPEDEIEAPESQMSDELQAEHDALDAILDDYHSSKKETMEESTFSKSLIICGWKNHLPDMLEHMLIQLDALETEWDHIVVVADINSEKANKFKERFNNEKRIRLFRGDFVNRASLINAGIKTATKIMILAEVDSGRSFQEIDARTVLTSMSINELNKRAYKIVEILNYKYEETLKYSDIEEIVPLDEIYQLMLVNGTNGLGLANVVNTLINLENRFFHLIPIASKHYKKTFSELLSNVDSINRIIIGVIEETGNTFVRKAEIIRKAQLEPRIKDSVNHLREVKKISANQVIINPKADYEIKPYSKLICLESSDPKGWQLYDERFDQSV